MIKMTDDKGIVVRTRGTLTRREIREQRSERSRSEALATRRASPVPPDVRDDPRSRSALSFPASRREALFRNRGRQRKSPSKPRPADAAPPREWLQESCSANACSQIQRRIVFQS